MNFAKLTVIGLTTTLLASCGPSATFDSPQPESVKIESGFAKKYLGQYHSKDSTSILTITKNLIFNTYQGQTEIPIQELDSGYRLKGDTLINLGTNAKEFVTKTDSSIIRNYTHIDTIFKIADGYVLKKYKGHYFLNSHYDENQKWKVNKLSLENNVLTFSSILGKDDIDKLNDITNIPEDTTQIPVNYNLSKKQFKKFLKADGFSSTDTFFRINNKGLLK